MTPEIASVLTNMKVEESGPRHGAPPYAISYGFVTALREDVGNEIVDLVRSYPDTTKHPDSGNSRALPFGLTIPWHTSPERRQIHVVARAEVSSTTPDKAYEGHRLDYYFAPLDTDRIGASNTRAVPVYGGGYVALKYYETEQLPTEQELPSVCPDQVPTEQITALIRRSYERLYAMSTGITAVRYNISLTGHGRFIL